MTDKVDNFKLSFNGGILLRDHPLEERGYWFIRGESDNPDFHGPHPMPNLGVCHGTLEAAIQWAVDQPRFFTYGGGGSIEKVDCIEVS